MDKKLK
jgi:hypothetical protein